MSFPAIREKYGRLRSLYHQFDDATVSKLENAILLAHVRAFSHSLAIFESFALPLKCNPVIAVEHCLVFWEQMRYTDAAKVLRDAISFAEENGEEVRAHGVFTWMRLLLANVDIMTEGNLTGAKEALKETRSWLREVPIEELDDVQIHALNRYYVLIGLATFCSCQFDPQKYSILPRVNDDAENSSLTVLRQHLQGQGRLYEAFTILKTEINHFEKDLKMGSIQSFLECCSESTESSTEPIWYLEGGGRLLLAELLQDSGSDDQNRYFELAQELYSRAPVPEPLNQLEIMIGLTRLKHSGGHLREKLTQWLSFMEQNDVKLDYPVMYGAFLQVTDIAADILRLDKSPEMRRMFWDLQSRAEAHIQERGVLCTLYIYHWNADTVAGLYGEDGVILKWHDDFHAMYPDFNLPGLLKTGYRKRVEIFERLKDLPNLRLAVEQLTSCVLQDGEFWRETPPRNMDETTGTHDQRQHSRDGYETSSQGRSLPDVGKHWHSEWSNDLLVYFDWNWHLGRGDKETDLPRDGSSPFITVDLDRSIGTVNSTYVTLLRWLQEAVESGEISVEDLEKIVQPSLKEQGGHENVCALLKTLSPENLYTRFSEMSATSWEQPFAIFSDWLLHKNKNMETKRQYLLAYLQHVRAMTIYSPDEKCIECQRMLTLIPQLNEKAAVSYKACLPCYRNGLARAKKMQLCRNLDDSGLYDETSQQFLEILNLYSQSLQECRAAGDLKMEFSTISEIAQLYFIPASKFRLLAVQNFFANVDAAEVVSQKIIERWSVLSGHTKVEKLLLAVEDASHHDLTLMGMHLLWRIPESQRAQRDAHMWCLIQRMKSRGFAWLMQSSALSARERSMATLEQTSPVGTTQFCHWDQLKPIARDSGTDVVFVDWYGALDGPGLSHFPVSLVTSHNGEAPRVWSCGKSWTEIEAVMDKVLVLDHSDLMQKNAKKLLQQLQPLIQPLAQASRPGQTLVFCSIGKMHRIPLHALDLDGEVLIRRNPVVYCSSLAALKVMFESRKFAETRTRQLGSGPQVSTTPWKAALFGGKRSTPEGTKALTTLAKKLNVNPYVDDAFTPWNFSSEIRSGVNLLHYHGHADFEENDPLNQNLIFEDDERFTVSDVYNLSPAGRSYHATLLACGTGMSKTSVSNEVVGLVPAFLYSGAASTVSTLWKFADQDAALFSDLFYEQFDEALKSGQGKRIDLAKALQRAVLRIMEAEDVLYHWAPFVLNGYWMLEVGGE